MESAAFKGNPLLRAALWRRQSKAQEAWQEPSPAARRDYANEEPLPGAGGDKRTLVPLALITHPGWEASVVH